MNPYACSLCYVPGTRQLRSRRPACSQLANTRPHLVLGLNSGSAKGGTELGANPAIGDSEQFVVLESYPDIQPWLNRVRQEADAHTHELGFLPRSAFEQFARKGWLHVLSQPSQAGLEYAGHLLFDVHFPRAHIRQMYVRENLRRSGCAALLLDRLRHSLTSLGYISIYARVAEDLSPANAFWQSQRFYVQRTERGGSSKNRHILVRCCELDSPQLFPPSSIDDTNPLGLIAPMSSETPMFLLDLNVLFDASRPRRLRRAEAVGLLQADRMNFCRLAISDEIRAELGRTSLSDRQTDPMGAFIDTFPCVPVAAKRQTDTLIEDLAAIVFPEAARAKALNANQRSDVRHLAAAINNELAGLVTNDQALLDAAERIEKRFRIQVLHSGYFESESRDIGQSECFDLMRQDTLRLLPVDGQREAEVRSFLTNGLRLSGSEVARLWLPLGAQSRVTVQVGVWVASKCIGYMTKLNRGASGGMLARVAINPGYAQAMEVARMLLLYLIDRVTESGPGIVHLEIPQQQPQLREIAAVLGFSENAESQKLVKLTLGRVLTPANWATNQGVLSSVGGPKLPAVPPHFRGVDQQLAVLTPDGNRRHITLDRFESLLSPALLCLPGRPAVITPVLKRYAEPLLGHSPQRPLFPLESASLFRERIFVGTPRALRHFRRGTLMFFYESGENGAIVAVARVREAYLKKADSFEVSDLHQSVLDTTHLDRIGKSAEKAVTLFDNIFPLPSPVSLTTLKRIGCGRPNDLITTKPITNDQTQAILAEGFPHES